jgi:hypothetical protein
MPASDNLAQPPRSTTSTGRNGISSRARLTEPRSPVQNPCSAPKPAPESPTIIHGAATLECRRPDRRSRRRARAGHPPAARVTLVSMISLATGQRPSTPAATITPAPCGPSAAPGHGYLWRCWQDRVPYDPERHRALQRHITVTIPTPSGPVPDLAATPRMPGAAVTAKAARRAEREALDSKPTSANTSGG